MAFKVIGTRKGFYVTQTQTQYGNMWTWVRMKSLTWVQ